jgi:hypothetical protein
VPAAGKLRHGIRRVLHDQLPAQRVTRRHCLHGHQPAGAALLFRRAGHAREAGAAGDLQAELARLGRQLRRRWLVTADDRVAAEQRPRVTCQPAVQAVGEKTHRRECGHRQHHGKSQEPQFTGAEVALRLAPCKGCDGRWAVSVLHGPTVTERPIPQGGQPSRQ